MAQSSAPGLAEHRLPVVDCGIGRAGQNQRFSSRATISPEAADAARELNDVWGLMFLESVKSPMSSENYSIFDRVYRGIVGKILRLDWSRPISSASSIVVTDGNVNFQLGELATKFVQSATDPDDVALLGGDLHSGLKILASSSDFVKTTFFSLVVYELSKSLTPAIDAFWQLHYLRLRLWGSQFDRFTPSSSTMSPLPTQVAEIRQQTTGTSERPNETNPNDMRLQESEEPAPAPTTDPSPQTETPASPPTGTPMISGESQTRPRTTRTLTQEQREFIMQKYDELGYVLEEELKKMPLFEGVEFPIEGAIFTSGGYLTPEGAYIVTGTPGFIAERPTSRRRQSGQGSGEGTPASAPPQGSGDTNPNVYPNYGPGAWIEPDDAAFDTGDIEESFEIDPITNTPTAEGAGPSANTPTAEGAGQNADTRTAEGAETSADTRTAEGTETSANTPTAEGTGDSGGGYKSIWDFLEVPPNTDQLTEETAKSADRGASSIPTEPVEKLKERVQVLSVHPVIVRDRFSSNAGKSSIIVPIGHKNTRTIVGRTAEGLEGLITYYNRYMADQMMCSQWVEEAKSLIDQSLASIWSQSGGEIEQRIGLGHKAYVGVVLIIKNSSGFHPSGAPYWPKWGEQGGLGTVLIETLQSTQGSEMDAPSFYVTENLLPVRSDNGQLVAFLLPFIMTIPDDRDDGLDVLGQKFQDALTSFTESLERENISVAVSPMGYSHGIAMIEPLPTATPPTTTPPTTSPVHDDELDPFK